MSGHQPPGPAGDVEKVSALPGGWPRNGDPFLGQGTMIEQSRAVAEVQAAAVLARQFPRDEQRCLGRMEIACSQRELADRSHYRYPRGRDEYGKTLYVSGPSVHLARELARCWGNLQYAIVELRRDYDQHHSEVLAYAWDLESNTRASAIFVVPHARDVTRDKVPTTDALPALRDVYENNANMGARRLREQIFAVLPVWYREKAIDVCNKALAGDGTVPLPERIANALSQWEARYRISKARLEAKLGRRTTDWTEQDLALMAVVWKSLGRGEVTVAEEFPVEPATAAEVAGQPAPPAPPAPPAEDQPASLGERGIQQQQQRKMRAMLAELGVTDRDAVLAKISMTLHSLAAGDPAIRGRDVESSKDLTFGEADQVINALQGEINKARARAEAAQPDPQEGMGDHAG